MTKTKPIIAISLAGIFAIGMLFSPVFAGGHLPLSIEKYEIEWNETMVKKVKIIEEPKKHLIKQRLRIRKWKKKLQQQKRN